MAVVLKNYRFIFLLSAQTLIRAFDYLPLAQEFIKKPIYYVYTRQLDNYSCGYNVLYNACSIEHLKVRYNKHTNMPLFKKKIQQFLHAKKARPEQASNSNWLYELATGLGLENFNYLIMEKQRVKPLFNKGITVEYILGTPKPVIEKMLADAWGKRENALIKKLQKKLSLPCCLHFACHVQPQGVDHVVLITIVRDNYARKSVYIFDNLNNAITPKSTVARYMQWIIKKFSI